MSQGRRPTDLVQGSLQYVALDPPPLLLDVAVGGAAVVALAGADLPHQVEEHLRQHPTVTHEEIVC